MNIFDGFICLMVGGTGPGLISDGVRLALTTAACDMRLEKKSVLIFAHDACDGEITTDWRSHVVGASAGILFKATVNEAVTYQVNFILNESRLQAGAKILKKHFRQGRLKAVPSPRPFTELPFLYEFGPAHMAQRSRTIN